MLFTFLDPSTISRSYGAGTINPGEMSLALRFTNFTGHGRIVRICFCFSQFPDGIEEILSAFSGRCQALSTGNARSGESERSGELTIPDLSNNPVFDEGLLLRRPKFRLLVFDK